MFNIHSKQFEQGHYPLFLGPDPGSIDNVNETYPEIARLRDELINKKWAWNEINLSKDAQDMQNPKLAADVAVMTETLSFQMAADSLATVGIEDVLGLYASNPELKGLLIEWKASEYCHAMAYSTIAKNTYQDPNDLFRAVSGSEVLLKRLKPISDILERAYYIGMTNKLSMMDEGGPAYTEETLRTQVLLTLSCIWALEAISFLGSFASTFTLCDATQKFAGVGSTVQLIAMDEALHTEFNRTIFDILLKIPSWKGTFDRIKPQIQKLFDLVMESERAWAKHLFSEGRQILGLNALLLIQYVEYLAAPVHDYLGLIKGFKRLDYNPLPDMDDWMNPDNKQDAGQEKQTNNYKVNTQVDDLDDDEELDF